jgi:hypothetical protein
LIDFKEYKKMAVKDRVFKGKIKQKGIYDYKAFYEFVYDYLSEDDYEVQLFEEMNEIIATIKSYLAIEGQHTV